MSRWSSRRRTSPAIVRLSYPDAGLGQRGVQSDRVVTGGEQEPVPARVGLIVLRAAAAQLVEVAAGEHVGDAERLADVPLALHLAHVEDVAAHPVGAVADPFGAGREIGDGHGCPS